MELIKLITPPSLFEYGRICINYLETMLHLVSENQKYPTIYCEILSRIGHRSKSTENIYLGTRAKL